MGIRRAISRAAADLAPMAGAPVPACAARSDGRNDDSVLLSRHRRPISEPLMWVDGFNKRGISQTTQPEHWKSTAAHPSPLAVHRSAVTSDGNQGGSDHDQRAAVDPALAEADHRQASAGRLGGLAASAGDYERQERRRLRISRAFRLALRPCLPTRAGDALSHPRRGSPPFEARKGSLRR